MAGHVIPIGSRAARETLSRVAASSGAPLDRGAFLRRLGKPTTIAFGPRGEIADILRERFPRIAADVAAHADTHTIPLVQIDGATAELKPVPRQWVSAAKTAPNRRQLVDLHRGAVAESWGAAAARQIDDPCVVVVDIGDPEGRAFVEAAGVKPEPLDALGNDAPVLVFAAPRAQVAANIRGATSRAALAKATRPVVCVACGGVGVY